MQENEKTGRQYPGIDRREFAYCAWRMYMENFKKKCKKTKKQVLNFFILIIILTFSMWIVGGNIYNYFEEKEIKNNIFVSKGWHINENREKPLEHIQAENQKYIITLERISTTNNKWRIIIGNNTFFEKYNL